MTRKTNMKLSIFNSVSFLAVATLFAGAAAAENRADLTQNGTSNNTLIQQITTTNGGAINPRNATAIVNQSDNRNSAAVTQSGLSETARITQRANDNRAQIDQVGSVSSYSQIDQESSANRAQTTQNGSLAVSYVRQLGGTDNNALVSQDSRSFSNLFQNGSYNSADVTQTDNGENDSTISQSGNGNYSLVMQNAGDHQSFITQNGDGNGADVRQFGATDAAYSSIVQTGAANQGTVRQQ